MADAKVERLKTMELFAGSSDKALAELASILDEAKVESGHVLMKQGMSSREAFFFIDGAADVLVDDKKVGEIHAGESAGEMGLLSRRLRSATVVTTAPTKLYILDGRLLEPLIEKHSELAIGMLETLSDRLMETNEMLAERL